MPIFGGVNHTGIVLPGLTVDGVTGAVDCNPAVEPGAGSPLDIRGAADAPCQTSTLGTFRNFSIWLFAAFHRAFLLYEAGSLE